MARTAVAKKKKAEVIAFNPDMFSADAGAGLTDLGTEDLAMPFLRILQKTSPELDEIDARAGDIYNTVTKEVLNGSDGCRVINCAYRLEHIEWEPLGQGSKAPFNIYPVGAMLPETFRNDDEKDFNDYVVDGDGRYLERTAQHYVLTIDGEGMTQQALVSMKTTQFKKSKQWNSALKSAKMKDSNGTLFVPPRFAQIFRLKTHKEENKKGSWFGWEISKEGYIEDANLYAEAKMFAESINAGQVNVQHQREESNIKQDEVPF